MMSPRKQVFGNSRLYRQNPIHRNPAARLQRTGRNSGTDRAEINQAQWRDIQGYPSASMPVGQVGSLEQAHHVQYHGPPQRAKKKKQK